MCIVSPRENAAAKGRRNVRASDYVDGIGGPPGPQLGEPRLTGCQVGVSRSPGSPPARRWIRRSGPLHHEGAVGHVGNPWGIGVAGAMQPPPSSLPPDLLDAGTRDPLEARPSGRPQHLALDLLRSLEMVPRGGGASRNRAQINGDSRSLPSRIGFAAIFPDARISHAGAAP